MRRHDAAVSIRSPPQRGKLSSTRLERLPRLARQHWRGWLRVWANLPLLVNGSAGLGPVGVPLALLPASGARVSARVVAIWVA
jgi:hypothetical protein